MPKALCISGMVIAFLLFLVFGLDLVTALMLGNGFPFGGVSRLMDAAFILCSGILGYLSWTTLREQT